METVVEKRRKTLINVLYFGFFVLVYYCTVKFALGYILPFVVAIALAVFLQRPINRIKHKLHLKSHGTVSTILVLLIVLLVVGVVSLLGYVLYSELKRFLVHLLSDFSSVEALLAAIRKYLVDFTQKLPVSVRDSAAGLVNNAFSKIQIGGEASSFDLSSLAAPISGAWSIVKGIPSFLVSLLVTVISCVFITADYESIRSMILGAMSRESGARLIAAKHTVTRGVGKLFKAYGTIMLITFTEMFIGLNLMKLIGVYEGGYIAIISLVTCVVDIVPVLGTGTVVLPWAVISLFMGKFGLGIGLIILYIVITVIRQIIEPKLVANQVGLPAIVTIMAIFLGGKVFGALGILILPLTVIVLKLMYDEGVFGNKGRTDSILSDEKAEEDEPQKPAQPEDADGEPAPEAEPAPDLPEE